MGDFKKLTVWQRAFSLALATYRGTAAFPANERFGLVAQMRRSATSVAADIAESSGRGHPGDQQRFLLIARGSARELECQLLLARELGFLPPDTYAGLCGPLDEVQRMLTVLARKIADQRPEPRDQR